MEDRAPCAGKRFQNGEAFLIRKRNIFRWVLKRMVLGLPKPPKGGYEAFARFWLEKPDFSGNEDAVWWLSHSSVLLRLSGKTILFDPVFSKRASPLHFSGPKRRTPSPVSVEALPPIDYVAISHSHYDHLDHATIGRILTQNPDVHFLLPLGLGVLLRRWGAQSVTEMNWWEHFDDPAFACHFVPAKHWSQRKPLQQNKSLWGGFVIKTPDKTFYFMGDSGYSARLAKIGARLGPIDLAALPIGAYKPRKLMKAQHIDPEEAVRLFQEIGCVRAFAMHWGCFELTDEPLDAPPQDLAKALIRHHVSNESFLTLKIGGKIIF